MPRILRKTISPAARDQCHLERTFTAIKKEGEKGVPEGSRAFLGSYGS